MTIQKATLILMGIIGLVLATTIGVSAAPAPSVVSESIGRGAHFEQGIYSLDNTLGQPVVGTYSQGETSLCVGFWCTISRFYSVYLPLVLRDFGG